MKDIEVIILAAGRGTRMRSDRPKVLQELHGRPMLRFVIEAAREGASPRRIILVLGYGAGEIKRIFGGFECVTQRRLLGSGDAVKKAERFFSGRKGDILVLYGDTPLITKNTIRKLIKKHEREDASCTLLTARIEDASGYGRILRDADGGIVKIAEDTGEASFRGSWAEINVGCYCFRKTDLFKGLERIKINKKKKEYYLTDLIEILAKGKKKIASLSCEDTEEAMGINTKSDLADANDIMRKRVLRRLMSRGITVTDPRTTFVDITAKIGRDTVLYPHTIIEKDVVIGRHCRIGPFARIREDTRIADGVEIGNFVELVRTRISSGTKVKHMTYLGDTVVGKNVNIGAGTITANFDGKNKHRTVIGDNAFVGVGSIFIAPVRVGSRAVVGAGSVVTRGKDVPPRKTVVGIPARILEKSRRPGPGSR